MVLPPLLASYTVALYAMLICFRLKSVTSATKHNQALWYMQVN
jgi:hypothetical protein